MASRWAPSRRWRWRPAVAATSRLRRVGGGTGGGGGQRRRGRRPQPVRRHGRHAPLRQLRRLGLARPGRHLLRVLVELRPALRPLAGDVQVRPRQGRRDARARTSPRRSARPATTPRPWTYKLRQGVKFEDGTPVTQQGRQVRRRAVAGQDDVPQRPDLLQRLPRPAGLHQPVRGPRPGQAGSQGDRDARRPDDRVPPEASRSAASTTSPSCRRRSRCPPAKDTGTQVQGARGLHAARTCSTPTTWARASR